MEVELCNVDDGRTEIQPDRYDEASSRFSQGFESP
jgi:hypothetical protein